jgi:folate-dependent tRNA-U54 methylase TrmFO/GidA
MNANFGLIEPLAAPPRDKARRKERLAERALGEIDAFARAVGVAAPGVPG